MSLYELNIKWRVESEGVKVLEINPEND